MRTGVGGKQEERKEAIKKCFMDNKASGTTRLLGLRTISIRPNCRVINVNWLNGVGSVGSGKRWVGQGHKGNVANDNE